jgi:hypothetical protein
MTDTVAKEPASSPFDEAQQRWLQAEDRFAGRFLGLCLAGFFLVLLGLMIGCFAWTYHHQADPVDPHAVVE